MLHDDMTERNETPNTFGERILEAALPSGDEFGRGFYTHSTTAPEWSAIPIGSPLFERIARALGLTKGIDDSNVIYGFLDDESRSIDAIPIQAYTDGDAVVGNFWDGDGTLVCGLIRSQTWVINRDCKKDYGWETVESPISDVFSVERSDEGSVGTQPQSKTRTVVKPSETKHIVETIMNPEHPTFELSPYRRTTCGNVEEQMIEMAKWTDCPQCREMHLIGRHTQDITQTW